MARGTVTAAAGMVCRVQGDWTPVAAQAWRAERDHLAGIGPSLRGYCVLCARQSRFLGQVAPGDFREGLHCVRCRCNARQRAAATVLLQQLRDAPRATVYITEQASSMFVALRKRVGRLLGSEFSGWRKRVRLTLWLLRYYRLASWVRREDVTALRFDDASLDGVVTLDVLEHVPDYRQALREFARVLRPGGMLVLTVPFYDQPGNDQVARIAADGSVEHLGTPEFHGDPLSGGVPCFHHFGWQLVADLRAAGFADAAAVRVQDAQQGLPMGLWVLQAIR